MNRLTARTRELRSLTLACLLAAVMLPACTDHTDPGGLPTPPSVELTAAPPAGSEVSYAVNIAWAGSDADGFVVRFEYAVDPPSQFTEDEIAGRSPGTVSEMLIPGANGTPDRTRVSKIVDGVEATFDWVHSTSFSHAFTFEAPDPDTTEEGEPTGRFTGMHAVYVRAVDDDGMVSSPEAVAFTAWTLAPSSTIVRPNINEGPLSTGRSVPVAWDGVDPDGPDKQPKGFVYKLVELEFAVILPGPGYPPPPEHHLDNSESGDWIYQDGDVRELTLSVEPGSYVFGIRAVDEAGVEEPFLEWGRNAFRFNTVPGGGIPILTVKCGFQTLTFPGNNVGLDVVAGKGLECTLSCSAESYGEQCSEFRWGYDIADLEADEGWTDWGTDTVIPANTSLTAGVHFLYIETRDVAGATTRGTVILNVVEFTFDKELLYVDDSFDDRYPLDSEHDAFWRDRITTHGFTPDQVGEHHAFLDNDRGTLTPEPPALSTLSRYKVVLWDNRGSGYNGTSGLFLATNRTHALATYMSAGGKLWLEGRMTVAGTTPSGSGERASMTYPKDITPGLFAHDFLFLRTTRIDNDKGNDTRGKHNLAAAIPFPGRPETYPHMDIDPDKLREGLFEYGVSHGDAVFDPMFLHSDPSFKGTMDSLYVYGATGNMLQDPVRNSTYHMRLMAIRWHDPDPARDQGRFQWFGFPLYPFKDSQAQVTFNRTMDWFREETAGP